MVFELDLEIGKIFFKGIHSPVSSNFLSDER